MIATQPRDEVTTSKADCYSGGERRWMEWGQQMRARLLTPLIRVLASLKVTPDHLTAVSLLTGLSFCGLWFRFVFDPRSMKLCFHNSCRPSIT